jgi:hypothetical protein
MHRPASQPPSRPYSSSSNPLTSPNPHQQQQPSPQSLSRESGYPSPPTPGYGTPSYEAYYGQAQDVTRQVDYVQQSYFSQPEGPVGRQQQRYQQSLTPQPMTPQPMTPGSHGAQTPQPPLTPQDGGMMSPAPYTGGVSANSFYPAAVAPQPVQQIVQGVPQHVSMVQQPMFGQPQSVPRPVTLQPQDQPGLAAPSPEPPTTPCKTLNCLVCTENSPCMLATIISIFCIQYVSTYVRGIKRHLPIRFTVFLDA